jgi:hypothetical protein
MALSLRKAVSAILVVVNVGMFVFVICFLVANPIPQTSVNAGFSPKTVEIPFAVSPKGSPPFANYNWIDGAITFTYPNGSLYAGDVVEVSATAILESASVKNVTVLYMGFEDAVKAPITLDSNGIPEAGYVNLYRTQNQTVLRGSGQMEWPTEGQYVIDLATGVLLGHTQQGGNITAVNDLGPNANFIIQVYPDTQAISLQTQAVGSQVNKLTYYLTFALILLTIAGAATNANDLFAKQQPLPPSSGQPLADESKKVSDKETDSTKDKHEGSDSPEAVTKQTHKRETSKHQDSATSDQTPNNN